MYFDFEMNQGSAYKQVLIIPRQGAPSVLKSCCSAATGNVEEETINST